MAAEADTPESRWSRIAGAIRDNNEELLLGTLLVALPIGFRINGFGGGKTLIHYAAIHSSASVVQRLIELGADVNKETKSNYADYDDENSYPIMIAINRVDPEMVGLLVRNRCDLTVTNGKGFTPLLQAAYRENVILLSIIASRLTTIHDRTPENLDTLDQIEPTLGMNALDMLCDIAVSYITSEPPMDVPLGVLQCAVYLIVEYTKEPRFNNLYRRGFPIYGKYNAPVIRRKQVARAAALERSAQADAVRDAAAGGGDWFALQDARQAAVAALAAVPPEPDPPVHRLTPMIEDFGMDLDSFTAIYEGLKRMGFAGDAVARRRLALFALARNAAAADGRAGGRRRKTQRRRRARRVKRVKQRTLRLRRRRV